MELPSASDLRHREHLKTDNSYESDATGTVHHEPPDTRSSDNLPTLKNQIKQRRSLIRQNFRSAQPTIFDKHESRNSTFFGFYTAFWFTSACFILNASIRNYNATGTFLGTNITSILLRDIHKIALTDLSMYLLTYVTFLLQLAVKHRLVNWNSLGWLLQSIWQLLYLVAFMYLSDYMEFPWIGAVFLLLHSLVLIMKQHSYAFYNGYFWNISSELKTAQSKLSQPQSKLTAETIETLEKQISFCTKELENQSDKLRFPANITLGDYFEYTMFPTLLYQVEYVRDKRIRLSYVFEKICAVFGVLYSMIVLAESHMYPIAMQALALRGSPAIVKLQHFVKLVGELIPPFILMYLLTFYIIWDAILNGIAELTRFGDREFYGDWWNSITLDYFAKTWNVPVHRFLLRHVYHSSMSSLRLNRTAATIATFLLSSVVHELVMFAIFKKLRGYLFILQMTQVPLLALSKTSFMQKRKLIGNLLLWFGVVTSPSIMCLLYLTF